MSTRLVCLKFLKSGKQLRFDEARLLEPAAYLYLRRDDDWSEENEHSVSVFLVLSDLPDTGDVEQSVLDSSDRWIERAQEIWRRRQLDYDPICAPSVI
jgi:hypothetical protein